MERAFEGLRLGDSRENQSAASVLFEEPLVTQLSRTNGCVHRPSSLAFT